MNLGQDTGYSSVNWNLCRAQESGGVIEEVEVVVLRFRNELRAPGCMHVILECVSPRSVFKPTPTKV
jgi:hypothetical protein